MRHRSMPGCSYSRANRSPRSGFRRPVPACLSRAGSRGRRPQPGRRKNFPGGRALLLAAAVLQIFPPPGSSAVLRPLAHRLAVMAAPYAVPVTPQTVEIFLKGERIAAHRRGSPNHGHTTLPEHMPSSHRRYADWTIERIRRAAASIGPATAALCELILERRPHPAAWCGHSVPLAWKQRPRGQSRLAP
jgi:hypothetical protein